MIATSIPTQSATYRIRDLSQVLNRSIASIHRDLCLDRLPLGFRIGRSRRWLVEEIQSWLRAGCPDRKTWEAMQNANGRRS